MRPILLAAALAACATAPAAPRPAPAQPPAVEGAKLAVGARTLTSVEGILSGTVTNPGPAPARLARARWKATVDGQPAGEGEAQLGIDLAPGGRATFELHAPVTLATTQDALGELAKKGELALGVTAEIDATGATPATLAAQGTLLVRAPRPPRVVAQDVTASRYEDHVTLTFSLGVENLNPFPVGVKRYAWTVTVEGRDLDSGSVPGGKVGPGENASIQVSQDITADNYPELKALLEKGRFAWRVAGTVELDEGPLRYDIPGDVAFSEGGR